MWCFVSVSLPGLFVFRTRLLLHFSMTLVHSLRDSAYVFLLPAFPFVSRFMHTSDCRSQDCRRGDGCKKCRVIRAINNVNATWKCSWLLRENPCLSIFALAPVWNGFLIIANFYATFRRNQAGFGAIVAINRRHHTSNTALQSAAHQHRLIKGVGGSANQRRNDHHHLQPRWVTGEFEFEHGVERLRQQQHDIQFEPKRHPRRRSGAGEKCFGDGTTAFDTHSVQLQCTAYAHVSLQRSTKNNQFEQQQVCILKSNVSVFLPHTQFPLTAARSGVHRLFGRALARFTTSSRKTAERISKSASKPLKSNSQSRPMRKRRRTSRFSALLIVTSK